MVRKHEIPRNIVIDGVKCHVWYKGQPLVCDICNNNHKAADCPLKGKCREAGHFVRNCLKPVWYVPGNPETDVDSDDDNADGDNDNDVNGEVEADNVAGPVAPGSVEPVVVPVVPVSSSPAASDSEVDVFSGGGGACDFFTVLYVCVGCRCTCVCSSRGYGCPG